MWRLKKNKPAFVVVDGPLTGREYRHNEIYMEIPAGAEKMFVQNIAPAGDPENKNPSPAGKGRKVKQEANDAQ
jgi:hypothetical protein